MTHLHDDNLLTEAARDLVRDTLFGNGLRGYGVRVRVVGENADPFARPRMSGAQAGELEISFEPDPLRTDTVVIVDGLRVFLDDSTHAALDGLAIDARRGGFGLVSR